MSAQAQCILVIRRRYLGDVVLLGIFLRNLRLHWPDCAIHALVEENYAGILALNSDVKQVHLLPRNSWALGRWGALVRDLRRCNFTHIFDLDNTEKTAALTRLTGAPFRAVLNISGRKLRLPSCYTLIKTVPQGFRDTHHISDFNNCFLDTIGAPTVDVPLELRPLPDDLAWAKALPAIATLPTDKPRLLVHPGSRSECRIWPAKNFAEVCDHMQHSGRASVTLIAGPAEQAVVNAIRQQMQTTPTVIDLQVPVTRLAALFQCFDLLLCHDSGPMHLATAVGIPVVALFSSQNINEWRPLGAKNATLQPPLPCTNCVAPSECVPSDSYRNYCVRNITPDRVSKVLDDWISGLM